MEGQPISPRKIFLVVCAVVSVLSLSAGYALTAGWVGAAIVMITGLAWFLARKYPASGLPHLCLLGSVGLAVTGLLNGSPPWLMFFGSGAALAAWDLLFLDDALGSTPSGEQTRRYEMDHVRSLALALSFGLFLTFVGRLLNLRIPFVVLMLSIALVVFGLERVWNYVNKMDKG